VPGFAGIKLTQDPNAAAAYRDLALIRIVERSRKIFTDRAGVIGDGGNSGFQALNLAIQFGADRIVLVGFDMNDVRGLHWHGPHGGGLANPDAYRFSRWRKILDDVAPSIAAMGIEVVDASIDGALTAYRKATIEQALDRWRVR
jgi:hypothetical protein